MGCTSTLFSCWLLDLGRLIKVLSPSYLSLQNERILSALALGIDLLIPGSQGLMLPPLVPGDNQRRIQSGGKHMQ